MKRREIDRHELELAAHLRSLPGPARLAKVDVTPDDGQLDAGTRPSWILRDAEGQRYFFKTATEEQMAAEELAYEVRSMGGRPTVASAKRTLDLGQGPVVGVLQPLVEHADERLPTEPTEWSKLQREVLLREHPWEWLLANLDTHVDQYVLIGPHRHPLNIDWDHTLVDIDVTELTRFTKRRVTVAPIRNLLYDHYADGSMGVGFGGLRREVERVRRLDDRTLRVHVARYAARLGKTPEESHLLAERFIDRKRRIVLTFSRLIATLRLDRLRARSATGPTAQRVARTLQAEWQRFVVQVLHDRVMRGIFRAKKVTLGWLLKARRG